MPTATTPRPAAPSPPGRNSGNPLHTRRGSLVAAVGTAIVAAIILVVFLNNYRNGDSSKTETVLAARSLLPKGSSGNAVASSGLFQAINVKHSQVKPGAITDPSALRGQVTTKAIFPGEQITAADLQSRGANGVVDELNGVQRAISIPVDPAHGLVGSLNAGDHVDIYGAYNLRGRQILRELAQNILVLRPAGAPTGGAVSGSNNTNGNGNVVLQVPENLAGKLALTAEYYKVWLTLRPPVGARQGARTTDGLGTALR